MPASVFSSATESAPVRTAAVGVITPDTTSDDAERSLQELHRLIDTAGGTVCVTLTQSREHYDARTCIGKGKIGELAELCKNEEITLAVFDTELTPSQIRNIEDALDSVSVIDRSMLILDIFAKHAVTADGKLQVELAQLKYTAPRLIGRGEVLSRLGGGIGTRGPGESQLETDRRHLKRRISSLEEQLDALEQNRSTIRSARLRSPTPTAAIVGYTNAGKSTLLNQMTDAGILAEDKLFATLDPTTRKFRLPSGRDILLTDTVGFIRNLPHHLIRAFRSTLDEAVFADLLLIVIDASDPEWQNQLTVTEQLLLDLGASGKSALYVFNKCDRVPDLLRSDAFCWEKHDTVCLSALTGEGLDTLADRIDAILNEGKRTALFRIPNAEQGIVARLYRTSVVEQVSYDEDAVYVTATVDAAVYGSLRSYLAVPAPAPDGEECDSEDPGYDG